MRVQTKRALAYHEAGHALLRLHLGLDVKEVSIVHDEESSSRGRVIGETPQCKHIEELGDHPLARLVVLVEEGMIHVAGPLAEKLINRSIPLAHIDYRVDYWGQAGEEMEPEERETFRNWIVRRTDNLLKTKRRYLDAIAEELFEREKLSSEQVEAIISDTAARLSEGRPE